MRYGDVLRMAESRARVMGLQVDTTELELAMYFQLQKLSDTYDLDAMTVDNPVVCVTEDGTESYQMPSDFGRLLHPRAAVNRVVESGFRLRESAYSLSDLTYRLPQEFARLDRTTTNVPTEFTIMRRHIYFNQVPNGEYEVQGTYIMDVGEPDLDDEIPIDQPSFLASAALYQMVADLPKMDQHVVTLLRREYDEQRSALVNGQARTRQALYLTQERIGRRR